MGSDPLHPGLGELGQRLQALGDPAEPLRLRPYQGGSGQAGPGQGVSAAAAAPERAVPPQPAYPNWQAVVPAPPEAYSDTAGPQPSLNGYAHAAGTQSLPPASAASPLNTPPSAPPASQTPASQAAAGLPGSDPAIPSGLQRAINAVRNTLPLVQRLLPMLEGNIATAATAITSLVAPPPAVHHIHTPPPVQPPAPIPPPVQVDLEPIERSLGEVERGLAEVRTTHRELRTQVVEHVTALKRVEDQLEHVREATDRNTLEQQELVEDLRAVGGRLSTFALIGLVLLVLSLLLNGYLIFQMQRILH